MIPLVDLKAGYVSEKDEIDSAIARVIENSSYVLGPEVSAFEKEWAGYTGMADTVGVSSATDGLYLALRACGIGEGHKVAIPAMTVTADYEAVVRTGAKAVVVDIDDHGSMSVDELQHYLAEIDAVIVVHLHGRPHPHIKELQGRCASHNVPLIEDCCHAHGASVGHYGRYAVWSFFPTKPLGCMGDAGAVGSAVQDLENIRAWRNHGRITKYVHHWTGGTMRLDGLQAAILRARLKAFPEKLKRRQEVCKTYDDAFDICSVESSRYVYSMLMPSAADKQRLSEKLKESGIGFGCHYPVPLNRQPCVEGHWECPVADSFSSRSISLPMWPEMDSSIQDTVIEAVLNSGAL